MIAPHPRDVSKFKDTELRKIKIEMKGPVSTTPPINFYNKPRPHD